MERTCSDAFIESHWCTCLNWEEVEVDKEEVLGAATSFVKFLNDYTQEHRDICEVLVLEKVMWAAKISPSNSKSFRGFGFLWMVI